MGISSTPIELTIYIVRELINYRDDREFDTYLHF